MPWTGPLSGDRPFVGLIGAEGKKNVSSASGGKVLIRPYSEEEARVDKVPPRQPPEAA